MNRAILIVICDFLVSSMLSMMTGMVPAHTGGSGIGLDEQSTRILLVELENTRSELLKARAALRAQSEHDGMTGEREAQLRELVRKLAQNELQIEKLQELARSTPENTGTLSKEELARRLDAEKLRRIEAEIVAREKEGSLKDARGTLRETQTALRESRAESEKLRRESAEGAKKLAENRDELVRRRLELENARLALKDMATQTDIVARRSGKLESDLAYTSGKLATAEKTLASSTDEIERLRRELEKEKATSREAAASRKEVSDFLQRTVNELTLTSTELKKTRAELAQSRASEERASGKLQILEKQLRNDVFARYSAAAAKLRVAVGESRVIGNLRRSAEYFLPLVTLNGKTYVLGATEMFSGGIGESFHFRDVRELEYSLSAEKLPETKLTGPLLVSGKMPRLAALETPAGTQASALAALTAEKLRARGVQNLYLFKAESFGKDSAPLGDRCALDMQNDAPALIVRNTARGAMELKARLGDFVLTGEGDFVGVVSSVIENGRFQEARVTFFDDALLRNADKVSLTPSGDGTYRAFADYMREAKKNWN